MNVRDRVIEIAHYRGESEIACKKCGQVSTPEELELIVTPDSHRARANCPGCGGYIKFMSTSKLVRLFDFNEKKLEVISTIETSILKWYLKKGKLGDYQVLKVNEELESRREVIRNETRLRELRDAQMDIRFDHLTGGDD